MEENKRLGLIGSGNMAEAMCKGVLKASLFSHDRIIASDNDKKRRDVFAKLGVHTTSDNKEILEKADIIVFAVKPQDIFEVLEEIKELCRKNHLFISIAAGIETKTIENLLGTVPVVRVMPTTPMLVGKGACALSSGKYAVNGHLDLADEIFSTAGITVQVKENRMDAVTALSGTGLASFFYFVEMLLKAAGEAGLNRDIAEKLLFQTATGAAVMVNESGKSPEKLRQMVTSPGGTTEAAIKCFEKNDLGGTLKEGFRQTVERSKQLRQKEA
jgi:pyrroline-5-carboxylate reductase